MRSDTGSATVWWVALCALLWFLTLAVLMAASVRLDRDRATTAADFAALAAAARTAQGTDHACARAGAVAEANRAVLQTCDLDGPVAEVSVSVSSSVLGRPVTARARAGPAHAVPPTGPAEFPGGPTVTGPPEGTRARHGRRREDTDAGVPRADSPWSPPVMPAPPPG